MLKLFGFRIVIYGWDTKINIIGQEGTYWIVPDQLAAGPHPIMIGAASLEQLIAGMLQAGFNSFVDLTEKGEIYQADYHQLLEHLKSTELVEFRYQRFAISDMTTPSRRKMAHLLSYLDEELSNGRQVYLHCQAGLGRTGTVAACYLTGKGLSGGEALVELAKIRRKQGEYQSSPETASQRMFVKSWRRG